MIPQESINDNRESILKIGFCFVVIMDSEHLSPLTGLFECGSTVCLFGSTALGHITP